MESSSAPTLTAPSLGSEVEEPCPQTLPSSRVPVVEVVVAQDDLPKDALFTFAKEVYERSLKQQEAIRSLQKGNRRLAKKRKSLAARLEVAKAKEAVANALLHRLRLACAEAGTSQLATKEARFRLVRLLDEAQEHLTGGRL